MQNATAQAIEENATVYAQDWSYRGTLNGTSTINAGGGSDTVLYVEHDGKEYIVGSGDVSFGEPDEYMRRRAKENVGDMLVCLDPLTGEIAYLPAKDVYYSREMSSDELKEARKQQLQQINSVPYNQAAQEQAAAEAAKPQPKEEAQAKETVTDGNQSGQPQKENAENFKVANSLQGKVGGSLSKDEAESLVSEMEARPEKARDLPLTPENWKTEFGENGEVNTPLGVAKMGENQLAKMFMKGREAELGLVKPTLENPDAIIEVGSSATDGNEERPSSYLFVKTFLGKNGEKVYYFKSVTVKKDGMEISISSHYDRAKRVMEELKKGKLLYLKRGDAQTEQNQPSVSGATSEEESAGSSVRKDTNNSSNGNGNNTTLTFEDGNPVPMTKDSKGRATPDYANMKPEQAAEILGKQFGESAEKVVDGQIKKAEKAVKDAEKMKVDYTAEPNDILEQEQQKKAVADAAKKQLEHAQATKKAMTQKKVAETMAKPEGEAVEGANEASGAVAEKFANATRLVGNKRTRTLANSEKISGHYEIVPAESLTPSHDAMNGYKKSEGFPVDENGRTINDRDYENDKAAQQTTDQMALKYNGQAIDQVPVVSDEGIVYDGNGRTMAGQKAAKDGTDGEYISDLLDNAENFGFTREQIEKSGIEHPRLVLVTDERMPYDTATFAKFNRNEKKTQSNTEQAVAKAKTLTADEVGSIVADIEGNGSLDAFFNNPKAINDLVKTLVSKGIIGQNEVAELMEGTDRLSPQGKELVKNLLLGSIFKPETIRMMGIDSAIKNKAIAGIRAVMDNMKLGDYSLRDEIDQAVQLLYEARQNGDNVDTLLRTPAMFGENAANRYPSVSQMMALALEGKVSDFRDLLNEYNREAAAHNTGEGNVFGDVPTKEELIRDFLNYKKWKDYDTRGNSEAEGGNDAEGIRKTEPEAQGGNGEGKPTESQRQVGEAVKKLATDITKQTGVTVHTDEKESQRALEDAEKTVREQRGDAGGAVLDWGNVPAKARISNDELTSIIMRNNRAYVDELDNLKDGDTIEHYVDANGFFYVFRVDKNHHIYMDEAIPKTSSANLERIEELKDYYDGERTRYAKEVYPNRRGTQSELGRSEDSNRSTAGERDKSDSAMGGEWEANSPNNVERDSSRSEKVSPGTEVRQFRTKDGEVYGFVVDGEIHLDTKRMKPETPLHEYTHLWTSALQRVNAKEWENVKGLLDSVDGLKEEVQKLYPELEGDDLYDEMLATYSGREGTKKLEAEARRLAAEEGKTLTESAKAKSFLGKVKEALKRYWNGVADMLGIHFTSAEEVADKVLADWASGVNPNEIKAEEKEGEKLSAPKTAKVDVDYEHPEKNIHITNTSNGYQTVTPFREEWQKKTGDERLSKDGWHEKNGYMYFIQHSVGGRGGDNCTIWFKDKLSEEQKRLVEEAFLKTNHLGEDFQHKLLDIVSGKAEEKLDPMASLRRNAEEYNNKVRMQKADEVEATAREHGVDATWLGRYAEGMREKNSAMAVMAMRDMKALYLRAHTAEKKALMEREGISGLIANRRLFEPIAKAIKAKYGDVDVLVEERRKQAEIERGMMEAARKRAEEEQLRREARLEELAQLTDEDVDKRYAEALEKGDETTAREMLDEAARRKGYGDAESDYQGVGAWSAPSDPGFATAEERRADVEKNGGDVNLEDIAHGYSPVQEEMYSHPERTGFGDESGIEAGHAINNALSALKEGKKDVKIKVYRAVPASVKEGKLRNGDWVTPSRKYAENHGDSRLEGKYRIIEDEVKASELWFDGNDIREWGYDNGKDYRYKNAKNNRKLNDLVTRDDKGNVIPPSKRFNSRKADERYQKADSKAQVDKREAALRDAVVEKLREGGMDVSMDAEEGQRVLDEANGKAKPQMGDASETFGERQKQAVEDKGVVMPNLNKAKVEVVKNIPRHSYTGNIAQATEQAIRNAKRKYAPNGNSKVLHYNNYGAEFAYTISGNAIEVCLSPKHQAKSGNKGLHLALAEHLDEIVNKSIEVEEHPDYIKSKDGKRGEEVNPNAIMHRFYGVAVIDGTPCRVMTLMREDGRSEETNGIHSYEVQKIEVLDNESPSTSNGVGTQAKEMSAYPLAKLLKGIEKAHDKGKFLLDESEKRSKDIREQRVYHGSAAGFDHVRFFRTEDGEAYGYTIGGKIYIDPRIASSETPIHEYAHLWATALRKGNEKEWQNVVGLMRDTKVWDEVRRKYPELEADDDIADEVLAMYSGRRGAERLRKEMGEADGEARGALERVKQALRKFWKATADMLHIHYTSAEDVADRVMKDLLDGMDPREFGGVSEKVRKQFIGERGAEKADRTEEVNTRLENLRVARKMEAESKDAKTIKMATGWERGADGKWRYEIADGKYHAKGDAEYDKLRSKQPWSKELDALEDRIFDGEELGESDSKRFEELAELESKFKVEFLSQEKRHLADWIENKELFDAYPDLKNVELVFTDQLPKNEGGYYSENENRLVVNTAFGMDNIESVIVHEVQHAIQRTEGFARGGSAEGVEREFQKAKAEWAARAYAHELEETAKELGDDHDQVAVEKALIKEYEDMDMQDWLPDMDTRIKGFNYFARGYADRSMDDAIKRFRLNESTRADFNPYLEYHKLAGEVESRNVQNRMSMTPAERRASLAAETEDVARKDQIFLNGSDDANPMDALARAAEEYHDGQRAKLQKKNRDDDGKNEELFVSLRNKKGKEYYDTVTELARRIEQGRNGSIQEGKETKSDWGRHGTESLPAIAGKILNAAYRDSHGQTGRLAGKTSKRQRKEGISFNSVYETIEEWAKRNNCYFNESDIEKDSYDGKVWNGGFESEVYRSKDGKHVIKVTPMASVFNDPMSYYIERNRYFNEVFPESGIDIVGYGRSKVGHYPTIITKQRLIEGETVKEHFGGDKEKGLAYIDAYLDSIGYGDKPKRPIEKELGLYADGGNDKFSIFDVNCGNVIIDKKGKPYVIDAEVLPLDYKDDGKIEINGKGTHFRMELGKTFSNSKEDFDGVRDRAVEEKGIVMPNLNKESVKVVPIEKHSFGNSDEGSIDVAKKWAYDNIVTKDFSNEPTMRDGTPYVISKKAIDKYLSSSATSKSENLGIHLSVLSKLTDVIRESIEAEIHPDYKKGEDGTRNSENGYGDNVLIHRLYGAVELDGKMYRVKTTMQEFRGGEENKPHSYEVTKIELLEGSKTANESDSLPLNSASNSSENELPNSPGTAVKPDSSPLSKTSDNSISVAKLLNGVEKSYDAGKKLLDESKDLTDGETSFRTINNSSETESTSASTIVADHVEKVSAKVGSKVRMVNSAEEVTNPTVKAAIERGEKVTGWYDEKTGEVHLYMPNIHDRYTAEKTIWHETVGHKAMRGLIGDENYSKFLRSIWYDLDKPENARLKELVSEELKYNPFDFENAVEEGIARLVEDGKGEPGFWNNIRNKVADILRSIGYHIAPNTKDVKYLLWLSKNLQKNPNNPYWKMRAEAVRYRLEHEKYTTIKNGMFADNDGKTKDYSDFTRKDWEEATDMTVHFRTTPAAATEIEIYNRAVGNVKAMAEEAYSDKMNSVLELYKAIDPSIKRAEDVKTSENPYMMENLMSSRAQQVGNAFVRDYMEPATKALGDVLGSFSGSDLDEKMRNANLYIVKKSGLERNRVFFVRDQIRKLSKKEETQADAKLLQSNWDIEHQTLKGELDNKQITLKEYFDGLDDFIRKNIDDKYKAGEHDYSGFHEMQGVDYNDAIDDANIQDEVMSAESSIGDSRKVDELWRTINAATDYSLDMEYEGGFMDREMNQYVKGEMNWYVPMRLFDEETAEDVYGYVNDNGSGTGFVGPALMKAKGRKSLSNLNILAQIGVMGEHAINRAARNGIKQAFMRFVNNNEKAPVGERLVTEVKPWFEKVVVGGVETWEERYPQIPEDATPLEISQAVAKFESDMKTKEANGEAKQGTRRGNINYKFADKAHRPQHIVDVWVNGRKKSYVINGNPRVAQAINGMLDHKSSNSWFSVSNRWLSQVCTSYNPEFTLRNTIRDFGFATHTLLGKEGAAYTMKFEKHYAALGFAPIINAAKGIGNGSIKDVKNALAISLFKQYKNGTLDVTKSKYHKWFKEFMDNGGETGYLQMKNVDAWKKQIENDIKDMHKGKLKKLHPIKAIGGFVEDMNEMAENIARFATFCASRESGRNVTRSAYDAKEVSVNFNRSGSAENVRSYKYENMSGKAEKARDAFGFSSSYLRNYTMFFNASMQSFKGLCRNVKHASVRTIASMVAEPIALGLMMPLINQMLYAVLDDDEKDRNGVKDPYLELPEYERRYNLCIYAGKGRFVKIPIAVEGRAFYGLGDIAASYTYKKDLKESRSLTLDIANQLSQIVPVGSFLESSATSGDSNAFLTSLGSTFLPSTISPAIELIGNRDWKGQPIYNDATYMKNAPAWKKAYKGTNELFLRANKKANAWTNDVDPGNENMKGSTAADVVTNPFVWEQVFNSYVGGMGTFATRMGVTIKHALSKDPSSG